MLPDELKGHGYIYVMLDQLNPNLIKIGLSKEPIDRQAQLYTTSTALPMTIKYIWTVTDMKLAEDVAHFFMRGHRVNGRREFFELVTPTAAIETDLETPHQHYNGEELADVYLYSLMEELESQWDYMGVEYRREDLSEYKQRRDFNKIMSQKYTKW
ncbi:GIY-YIG nuclease family protein [Vibrio aestuarianus]|nr:GIY-YIG nuclease family protein [Vibrio aestuarianus]